MTTWDKGFIACVFALLLAFAVQTWGAVIEGAYEGCDYTWHPWAQNGGYWLAGPDNLYIIAHGYYGRIYPNCGQPGIGPEDIGQYDFIFVGACDGMNEVGAGTFSGRAKEAVGYQHLTESYCDSCWNHSLAFQDYLFRRHAEGSPWSVAYDKAIAAFPECKSCTRYFNRAADIVNKILLPHLLR